MKKMLLFLSFFISASGLYGKSVRDFLPVPTHWYEWGYWTGPQIKAIDGGVLGDFRGLGLTSLDGISDYPGIENVTYLDLRFNDLRMLNRSYFDKLDRLQTIDVRSNNKLNNAESEYFKDLESVLKVRILRGRDPIEINVERMRINYDD